MYLVAVLRYALYVLCPLSLILTSYLYFYPVFHLCAFPVPGRDASTSFLHTVRQHTPLSAPSKIAPFRLLALGDPQLEGDTSIDPEAATFPNFAKFWKDALLLDGTSHNPLQRLRHSLHDIIDFYLDDIPKALGALRKRVDHVGNDFYLGHIYRQLYRWTDPTHVTVLGDLVGSQWISDEEFDSRGWRFWKRVFRHAEKVSNDTALQSTSAKPYILGEDAIPWKKRIINVAGNHDIGYAGDLSPERIERFERVFGKVNYELRFDHPVNKTMSLDDVDSGTTKDVPSLRIVVLNDMNLDTPALSKDMQDATYGFVNDIITSSEDVTRPAHFTLVLTHIPLHKEAGTCVDPPFFDFFKDDERFGNGIKEQYHLSRDASKGFMEGLFGMSGDVNAPGQGYGRKGVILNGHDHEGCDTYHYINQSDPERQWQAQKWRDAQSSAIVNRPGVPGLREITVRSMMGDFGGNAGLLSLWFDEENWEWRFEFVNCALGKQHIWWIVHILDLVTAGVALAFVGFATLETISSDTPNSASKATAESATEIRPKTPKPSRKIEIGSTPETPTYSPSNGSLDVPGSGRHSVRKKKSKRNLHVGA